MILKIQSIVSLLRTWLIVILLCQIQDISAVRNPPKIGISKWMTIESAREAPYSWDDGNLTPLLLNGALSVHRNGDDTTFVVSKHIERLQIVCNASYPVTWISQESAFHTDTMYSYLFAVYETRIAPNIKNPKSFMYQSTLDVFDSSGSASRNYTCQSLSDPNIQRSVYIFWEGNSFLTLAGEVIDTRTTDNKTVVLPCTVSKPDATVYLFKETESGYKELLKNETITFNPKIGFTLDIQQLQAPYGRFKCVSEDESEDDETSAVRINVLHEFHDISKKTVFNDTIRSNASFRFEAENRKLVCCSSSGRAPNLKMIYCHHPIACKAQERFLKKISSTSRWVKNGSCTILEVYPNDSGILRCKGDNIDVFRTYFTSLSPRNESATMSIYFGLDNIPKHELVSLMTPGGLDPLVYIGQNFTAYCETSAFYFSKGIKWAIRWKNNSLQYLDESYNPNAQSQVYHHTVEDFVNVMFPVHLEMDSLLCYAPVWNSSEWVTSDLKLEIKESIAPMVTLLESGHLQWVLNETGKTLSCLAQGEPLPYISWTLNNRTIHPSAENMDIIMDYENGTSVLVIKRVSYAAQGNYSCVGSNFVGSDHETVGVHVSDSKLAADQSSSSSVGLIIFITTVISFCLLLGVLVLIWKLNLQKKIIDHLAGVVFRDVDK